MQRLLEKTIMQIMLEKACACAYAYSNQRGYHSLRTQTFGYHRMIMESWVCYISYGQTMNIRMIMESCVCDISCGQTMNIRMIMESCVCYISCGQTMNIRMKDLMAGNVTK